MKLLIDDTTARTHNLNANEACVFAAILKCTKSGRGWFANYRDLANALPFVISHVTVFNAVRKLLNLGLIERRENSLFALLKNETELLNNETDLLKNETNQLNNLTESISPNNPFIINNEIMNEKEHATCAQTRDTRKPETLMYFEIRKIFNDKHGLHTVGQGLQAEESWKNASPAKKQKLLDAVRSGDWDKPRLDWLVADFPEPLPDFLRGDETDADIVQVRYNGLFKLCTRETMNLFGLEYVRDWK